MVRFALPALVLSLLLSACKTAGPVLQEEAVPGARLVPEKIGAGEIGRVSLWFSLAVENPRSGPVSAGIGGWRLFLDGAESPAEAAGIPEAAEIAGGASASFPLRLDLELPPEGAPPGGPDSGGDHRARLVLDLVYTGEGGRVFAGEVSAEAAFPRVREPVFTITGIAIMRAELINTQFRVDLRIDNPNGFPLELASLDYELYGAGRFWAGGSEAGILHIPPESSAGVRLFLVMNFINMRRDLLDQIIASRRVSYRITGSADIITGLDYLPRFRTAFDRSGLSDVTD